jgi:hypothetical protein
MSAGYAGLHADQASRRADPVSVREVRIWQSVDILVGLIILGSP